MLTGNRFIFIGLLALVLHAGAAVSATTFKIATVVPDGSYWMQQFRETAKLIQDKTQGRVAFKFYPGGVMGNDSSVLRKMRAGQLQGGTFTSGSLSDIYPDLQVYSVPLAFRSFEEVDYVRQRMDDQLRQGMEAHGYILAGISEGGFAYMMSNKPIHGISDLTGQKVWIPEGDRINQATFTEAGITPIPLPVADTYTGLQTGLIDTVATSPVGAIALQWHTKIQYVTESPLVYITGILMLSKNIFDRLSVNDQQTVRTALDETFERIEHQNRIDHKKAVDALKNQGIRFIKPNSQDQIKWHRIAEQVVDRLLNEGLFSRETFALLQEHLAAFRAQTNAAR